MKASAFFGKLICIVIGFITAFFCVKTTQVDYIAYAANNFCDGSTIFFKQAAAEQSDFVSMLDGLDFVQAHINTNYYAVDFNGTKHMPIISGDFFESTQGYDYNAVVGKNYVESIRYSDGVPYIKFNNTDFHVCGVIGMDGASPLDKNIYFYLPEFMEWLSPDTTYSSSDASVKALKGLEFVYNDTVNYSNILQSGVYKVVLVLLIISVLFITMFHSNHICKITDDDNTLLFLLGYPVGRIIGYNFKKYLFCFGLFYPLGSCAAVLLFYKPYYSAACIFSACAVIALIFLFGYGYVYFSAIKKERKRYESYNI